MKKEKTFRKETHKKVCRHMTIALLFLTAISIFTQSVCAHAPSTMILTYDTETQDLQVTISHQVSSPTNHYIQSIEIKKNEQMYNISTYTEQPTTNSFSYTYKINATAGDVIEVYALCNQGGSKTAQYTVGQTTNGNDTSTPGFELLLFFGAVLIGLILLRRKKF